MVRLTSLSLALVLAVASVKGHFLLLTPPPVAQLNEDTEGTAPCGGAAISFTNVTDFHVDGDAIAVKTTHPAANWLFRATLDRTAGGNWTNLMPVIAQSALGDFCEPVVKIPSDFVGQTGIIQVIQNAVDGELFECAAVNFVSGAAPSIPSACNNATGVTGAFTTDATLVALASATGSPGSSSPAAAATTTGSSSSSAPSPSATKSGAASITKSDSFGPLFWGAIVAFASVTIAAGL